MEQFGSRLAEARSRKGISQAVLARILDVATSTIGQYETGARNPGLDTIEQLAAALDVTPEWLAFNYDSQLPSEEVSVPVYNTPISAGPGTELVDQSNEPAFFFRATKEMVREWTRVTPDKLGIFRVDGISMQPSIFDGELVLVDLSHKSFTGDGVYLLRSVGDILQFKRVLQRYGTNGYTVRNDNPNFPAFEVDAGGIEVWGKALRVIGRKLD